jgi:hypothetical protein
VSHPSQFHREGWGIRATREPLSSPIEKTVILNRNRSFAFCCCIFAVAFCCCILLLHLHLHLHLLWRLHLHLQLKVPAVILNAVKDPEETTRPQPHASFDPHLCRLCPFLFLLPPAFAACLSPSLLPHAFALATAFATAFAACLLPSHLRPFFRISAGL